MKFGVDKPRQTVASAERWTSPGPMLIDPFREIRRHASVEDTAGFVGHDIGPTAHPTSYRVPIEMRLSLA